MLNRFAPFWTALIVGGIWWVWHFALYRTSVFASPGSAFNFFAYLVTWSILMVFLVERGGGSVWPAVALHWGSQYAPECFAIAAAVRRRRNPARRFQGLAVLSRCCAHLRCHQPPVF